MSRNAGSRTRHSSAVRGREMLPPHNRVLDTGHRVPSISARRGLSGRQRPRYGLPRPRRNALSSASIDGHRWSPGRSAVAGTAISSRHAQAAARPREDGKRWFMAGGGGSSSHLVRPYFRRREPRPGSTLSSSTSTTTSRPMGRWPGLCRQLVLSVDSWSTAAPTLIGVDGAPSRLLVLLEVQSIKPSRRALTMISGRAVMSFSRPARRLDSMT